MASACRKTVAPRVGLSSMREQAGGFGGTCVVEPSLPGGTRVLARLPYPSMDRSRGLPTSDARQAVLSR